MKPLITIQKALTLLCICRADETKRKWIKFVYVVLTSVILAVKVSFFCSSTAFFLKNMSSDLDAALFALLQMVAGLAAIYTLIVALVIRYKIRDTIKNLTDIYDTSNKVLISNIGKNIPVNFHSEFQMLKMIHFDS